MRNLPQRPGRGSYPVVSLWLNGRRVLRSVHTLVCEAFHGPKPDPKHHAAHWDGDRQNARADNLRWASPRENEADKVRHGRTLIGRHHGPTKLSEDEVREIRRRWAALPRSSGGERVKKGAAGPLAEEFGICLPYLREVVRGGTWRGV
jgi:hypothetical protein